MNADSLDIAGLRTLVAEPGAPPRLLVVVLHGYAMRPEALAPFAFSMGTPARFLLPEGPCRAEPEGRAWWELDVVARAAAMAVGPRDLATAHPPGAAHARERLLRFCRDARARWPGLPMAIVGFSQGGMLACDLLVREDVGVAALALLSASRISLDEWRPGLHRLQGLPVLVSHGLGDPDLAYTAGEALRDMCQSAGARVTWVPFDGGHEIPLVVWRALKKFLGQA